jgi:hypothetical protein
MFEHFILWCYSSPLLDWFRNTKYSIPVLQSFHILGLTAVLGIVCILSIRLLGVGMLKLPLATLWRELSGWFLGALILTISAGIVIWIIDPTRYLANTSFRVKMCLLLIAIVFQYTIVRPVVRRPVPESIGRATTPGQALLGALSLLLWFGVGWGGRLIAFFT